MAKLVKVINPNKFDVGVKLMDGIRSINIRHGAFTMLDENEVYYINQVSGLFKRKMLVVEDEDVVQNMGFAPDEAKNLTDDEIATLLKGNHLKMKKELEKITEPHIKDRVYNIAKTLDLSASKLKIISDFVGRPIELDDISSDDTD
jgi:hypothetical protein